MAAVRSPREMAALWYAVLGGAVVWAAHLGVTYALVQPVCAGWPAAAFHLVHAAALAGAVGAGLVAFGFWRRSREAPAEARSARAVRFLAVFGMTLDGLFAAVIAAEALPTLLHGPCVWLVR